MSLNTAHAGKDGVVLFNTERIFIYHDGVEMSFDKTSDDHLKGKKNGRIYLTTHRVIFVNGSKKDKLQSLSMPFHTMKKLELEQPVFGANYISGVVLAEQGGNWHGDAKFKMSFNRGGAIEFGQAMLQAGKLASRHTPSQPPTYTPPTAPYYEAPPPAYTPQGQYGGIYPSPVFNVQPPPGTVFMYDVPPPYPGVDPNMPAYPISTQPAQPFNVPQYPGLFPKMSHHHAAPSRAQSLPQTQTIHISTGQPQPYPGAVPQYPGTQPQYPPGGVPQYPGGASQYPGAGVPPYPGAQPQYPGGGPGQYPPSGVPQYPGTQPQYPGTQPQYPGTQPQYPAGGGQPPYNPGAVPPSYPGNQPPYPNAGNQSAFNPQYSANQNSAASAKEAEALGYGSQGYGGQGYGGQGQGGYGGQGYYDPAHPQNLYMPPTSMQPPKYDADAKKKD